MADLEGSNGQRTEFRIVGKHNIPGRLSYATASGKARFAMDVTVPGMLHAKYLRSPYGRARIKSVDVGRARKLPGVVDIITWEDPDIRNLPPAAIPMLSNEADMEDEEIGVIVVAESEELCDEALKVIKVEWEALPHILDPREGRKPDAPVLRENPRGKGNVQTVVLSDGDIEAGFREADHIIEFDWNISLCSAHHPNPAIGLSWWYDDHVSSEGKNLFIEGAYITRGSSELSAMYKVPRDKLY
ncbi:MAG TPA: hypothetical protein VLL97_05840, partial [Acidobacteriota bacterium]|nr:hypothetical protein [Acidobacteriota bacterium]